MESALDGIGKQWMPKGCGMGNSRNVCEGVHQQPKFSYVEHIKWGIPNMLRHWTKICCLFNFLTYRTFWTVENQSLKLKEQTSWIKTLKCSIHLFMIKLSLHSNFQVTKHVQSFIKRGFIFLLKFKVFLQCLKIC
jgi:hypothetical protein